MKIRNKHIAWFLMVSAYIGLGVVAVAGWITHYWLGWSSFVGFLFSVFFGIATLVGFISLIITLMDDPHEVMFDTNRTKHEVL